MNTTPVVGLDIGGRSVKYTVLTPAGSKYQATGGIASSYHMEFELEQIFKQLAARIPDDVSCIGATMSYPISCRTYGKGVEKIVNLFQKVVPEKPVFFIDFESRMWPLQEVMSADPARFAMSNFFGSAYLGSKIRSNAVVMDTGSTSTDILLTRDNCPVAIGQDTSSIRRQLTGEMTWTGVIATLISSLTEYVPLRGRLVKGSPRGGTTNDVYNILYYEKMRDLLGMYGVKQKKKDDYYLDMAAYFAYDLENIEPVEIENMARYVSVKHVEVVAGFLLQVLSYHELNVKNTDFVLMGIGKDILLKKVLNLLDVDQSRIFDAADYTPGDLWAHGSSVGAALRTLDHAAGEHVPLSSIERGEIHG
jgi:uncharacterized hydantoinase/oxoprolinase family protein